MTFLGIDSIAFWIIATGALVNMAGATLGSFLVLRKMSLLGDALSHAVLPGLAVAFIVTGSRSSLPMFIGAIAAALITVFLIQLIQRFTSVYEDSAMGVVFTSLFALGVILITKAASHVDLDASCVLYGVLETAALDTVTVGALEIPRVALNMGVITIIVYFFIILLWKELKIVTFDENLAKALGIRVNLVHYLFMTLVAGVTVAAFEAVGSILIVAMLIAPPAAAYLLTDRLWIMVLLANVIGIASAIAGRYSASYLETNTAGMMAVAAGGFLFLSVIFAPKYGYLSRKISEFSLSFKIVKEDVLGILYRWHEVYPNKSLSAGHIQKSLDSGLVVNLSLWRLVKERLIEHLDEGFMLTERGMKKAGALISGHRLWETYLAEELGIPLDHVHEPAHRVEHYLDEKMRSDIATKVQNPASDPHGKVIPRE